MRPSRFIRPAVVRYKGPFFIQVSNKRVSAQHSNGNASELSIGIPGLRIILDKAQKPVVRFAWTVILMVCTLLMMVQIRNRFLFYLSDPINVDFQYKHNRSLQFPSITLCQQNVSQSENYYDDNIINFIREEKESASQLNGFRDECKFERDKDCDAVGEWIIQYTILGRCFTYTLNHEMNISGAYHGFYLVLKDPNVTKKTENMRIEWKLLVHRSDEIPKLNVLIKGNKISPNTQTEISVKLRQFQAINLRHRPCIQDRSYRRHNCQAICFDLYFLNQLNGCRLSFVSAVDAPNCSSLENYTKAWELAKNAISNGLWKPNQCSCIRECNEYLYDLNFDSRERSDNEARVKIFFNDMAYDKVLEHRSYGVVPLLCDIGGVMGLFLGASALTFVEILEAIIDIILTAVRKG